MFTQYICTLFIYRHREAQQATNRTVKGINSGMRLGSDRARRYSGGDSQLLGTQLIMGLTCRGDSLLMEFHQGDEGLLPCKSNKSLGDCVGSWAISALGSIGAGNLSPRSGAGLWPFCF